MHEFTSDSLQKNDYVTIATDEKKDNHGLPYWLGRITNIGQQAGSGDTDDSSSEEDIPLAKRSKKGVGQIEVEVVEYRQKTHKKCAGLGNMKHADRQYGEAKGQRGNKVKTLVPISSILWKFPKLTKAGGIPKLDANWTIYWAEIMLKSEGCIDPVGVAEMNKECGYKMAPVTCRKRR